MKYGYVPRKSFRIQIIDEVLEFLLIHIVLLDIRSHFDLFCLKVESVSTRTYNSVSQISNDLHHFHDHLQRRKVFSSATNASENIISTISVE
jgi:hypothetical protein